MATNRDDVSDRVRFYRLAIAREMEALTLTELGTPSWCAGWRIQDVLGHLVYIAEATSFTIVRDLVLGGMAPNRALANKARDLGQRSVTELCNRLRSADGIGWHTPGAPAVVGIGDLMVHGNDALRPIGKVFDVKVEDVVPLLDIYRRTALFVFKQSAPKRVKLVADDADWSAGSGPEVRGSAIDLLLLLANRRQVIDQLSGPGVAIVR